MNLPHSPFTTPLSSSVRETELRIRSILQWKKRRPPLPALILALLLVLLCGGLVSCQAQAEEEPPDTDLISLPVKGEVAVSPEDETLWDQLSPEQQALLADLPVSQLPREAVDLDSVTSEDIWQGTLLPAHFDPETDTTLYLVLANNEKAKGLSYGLVLRHLDQAAYFPLPYSVYYSYGSFWMETGDFNGDGHWDAAVCLLWGHGTGVYVESLYLFDLETLTYAVPDFSSLAEATASYDPETGTATLQIGSSSVTVPLPEEHPPVEQVGFGDQVRYSYWDGQISCQLGFDFSGMLTGYYVQGSAPILWKDGRYQLGSMALSQNDAYYP